MTEITDLSPTDASNTQVTGESLDGNVANMGRMDNTLQAIMGLLARSIRTNVFRIMDNSDDTKELALDLSGQTTATTRTQKTPNYNGTLASQALGTAIPSATTTDIGAASGSTVHVTGTTTIADLGTADAGIERTVIFDGILTLTHNATSLILPGAANITTAAGDTAVFVSEGSGNWRCRGYQRASGEALSALFSASFVSSNQSITLGGLLTIAHGLGTTPTLIQQWLVCTTTNRSWSPGDEVLCQPSTGDAGTSSVSSQNGVYADATNVYIRMGTSAPIIPDKTNGGAGAITVGSWAYKIRAWA